VILLLVHAAKMKLLRSYTVASLGRDGAGRAAPSGGNIVMMV